MTGRGPNGNLAAPGAARRKRRRALVALALAAWIATTVIGHAVTGDGWAGSAVNALAFLPFAALGLALALLLLVTLADALFSLVTLAGVFALQPIVGRTAALRWSDRVEARAARLSRRLLDLAGLPPERTETT